MADHVESEESATPPGLLTMRQCHFLIAAWVAAWVVGHYLFFFFLRKGKVAFWPTSPLGTYSRRLLRSQVYCMLCVGAGFLLLTRCSWSVVGLLHTFSMPHQVMFSCAVAHWLVSIWEDAQCHTWLGAGLHPSFIQDEFGSHNEYLDNLFQAYLAHHVVAAAGFYGMLRLQGASAVGVFGLIFELPVLFMNIREMAIIKNPRWSFFYKYKQLRQFWNILSGCFFVGRFGPTAVYIYSILFWRGDLSKLDTSEQLVYHFMGIFFSLLNFRLKGLLGMWLQSDMIFLREHLKMDEATDKSFHNVPLRAGAMAKKGDSTPVEDDVEDGEAAPKTLIPKEPLREISAELFYDKERIINFDPIDTTEDKVLVEIDGIAYELTHFVKEHPGGEEILRQYNRRDASEAFHRARHSFGAKHRMSNYARGAIVKAPDSYRIFEYMGPGIDMVSESFVFVVAFVALCFVSTYATFGITVLSLPQGASWAELLAPGLLCCALHGLHALLGTLASCSFRLVPGVWTAAIGVLLRIVGFVLALRPMPSACPANCPTVFELTAVAMFVIQDFVEAGPFKGWTKPGLFSLAALSFSWWQRGVSSVLDAAPELTAAALMMATGHMLIAWAVGVGSPKERLTLLVNLSGAVATVFSALCLLGLTVVSPEVVTVLQASVNASWKAWLATLACIRVMYEGHRYLIETAGDESAAYQVRKLAQFATWGAFFWNGLFGWRWLAMAAWYGHNASVARRYVALQDIAAFTPEFKEKVGEKALYARTLWDSWKGFTLLIMWNTVTIPFTYLMEALIPEDLKVYASTIPIFQLGDDVDFGVAAYTAPYTAVSAKVVPEHFECRVEHFNPTDERAEYGFRGAEGHFGVKNERKSPPGLVAEVVMHFFNIKGLSCAKRIILRTWQTEEECEDWNKSKKLPEQTERGIGVNDTRVGYTLEPHGEIRHQSRCQKCYRLVEADKLGKRAPLICSACGKEAYRYAFF